MNLRRTIASVFVAVALLGAGFVPAASADAPALPAKSSTTAPKSSKTKVTSKPSTVTNKTKFTVKGKVSPARKGAVVELQRLNGKKKWVKVASTKTSSSGAYKLSAKISRTSSSATLGANTALKMISRYSSGIDPQISIARCIVRSSRPPKYPCTAPASTPSTTPMAVSASANRTLTRNP